MYESGIPRAYIDSQLGINRETIHIWIKEIIEVGLLEFLDQYTQAKKGERSKRKIDGLDVTNRLRNDNIYPIMLGEQLGVQSRVSERDWVKQAEDLAYYFARPLKMSRWQYLDTLPEYSPQPEEYQGRFDTLVLVQPPKPELPLKRILDIVRLHYNPDVLKMEDWQDDRGRFRTPAIPYATWLDDGAKRINIKPSVVRESLLEDERAGTGLDGIFLWLSDRGVVRRHFLDLAGSQVDFSYTPYLFLWFIGPALDYDWAGDANSNFGAVVAGRKIVTRESVARL